MATKRKPIGYHYVVYWDGKYFTEWKGEKDAEMMRHISYYLGSTYWDMIEGVKIQIERYAYYTKSEEYGDSDRYFIMSVIPLKTYHSYIAKWRIRYLGKRGKGFGAEHIIKFPSR